MGGAVGGSVLRLGAECRQPSPGLSFVSWNSLMLGSAGGRGGGCGGVTRAGVRSHRAVLCFCAKSSSHKAAFSVA